jgi:glutamate synthase (NADPH/NADH) small chain
MMGYVDTKRQMPDKRSAEQRRQDFDEIYNEFDAQKAAEQANRCAQCGVPFCQVYCPLHNNIPDWLRLTAEGRLEEAYEVASSTNTFPEICGRICPKDRLCEGNCVIEQAGHGTVTIGSVEKYITEKAFDNGWVKPRTPENERDQHVGIIGAGPAGLAAAEMLRAWGYQVTVYDRYDRIGGLMIYGIPNFKMDKYVMARRAEQLEDQGVQFHMNTEIGDDITFGDLRTRHDSILIATGVYAARDLEGEGNDLEGVVQSLDFLIAENRHGLGDAVPEQESGRLYARGKTVVVIGGGDTAMDCVRTAVRQGARDVTCLYRRDRQNMPGSAREVHNAEEEGVVFDWLKAPRALYGHDNGAVTGVSAQQMALGEPDESWRRRPVPVEDSEYDMDADMVIKALGFEPEDLPALFDEPALTVREDGTLSVDDTTLMTALDGVFAAGDIVRGASLVVWGIRDGRDAAQAMHDYMQARDRDGVAAE